jgi:ABC-type iron transport system FetAB ATPase subunit
MVEKITRLELKGCERQRIAMVRELSTNCEAFLHSEYILGFEKEWMVKYI